MTDVENKIPDPIDTRLLEKNFKITYEDSISIMMHGEVAKYNNLLSHLKSQVLVLLQCLDGETLFDAGMEAVLQSICTDCTPPSWLLKSYPGSESLPNYLSNLQDRVDYIKEVLEQKEPTQRLFAFWLPGLFDQANFFSVLLQQEARARKQPLHSLSLQYTVTDIGIDEETPGTLGSHRIETAKKLRRSGPPRQGGYYVYGLFVEGAHWSRQRSVLEDVQPGRLGLVDPLPAVHVEAV